MCLLLSYFWQETHLIHKFKEDFYGQTLSVAMVGYIRPERGFNSLGKTRDPLHIHVFVDSHMHALDTDSQPSRRCNLCVLYFTEELIAAIHGDIEEAKKKLDLPEHLKLKEDNFFRTSVPTTSDQIMNGH